MSQSPTGHNSRFHFADLYPKRSTRPSKDIRLAVNREMSMARGKAARKRALLIAQLAKEQAHDQANY